VPLEYKDLWIRYGPWPSLKTKWKKRVWPTLDSKKFPKSAMLWYHMLLRYLPTSHNPTKTKPLLHNIMKKIVYIWFSLVYMIFSLFLFREELSSKDYSVWEIACWIVLWFENMCSNPLWGLLLVTSWRC